MVVAVAKAAQDGARAIVCASTGNTSASAAAYGAHAGMEVIVVLPKGQIAKGKLLQAQMAGARVVAIDGNFDQALAIVRALAEQDDHPITLVNSVNPYRIDGQKTAAFEVCDQLGRAPDILAIPVGNAGNISAYWAGFRDYAAAGRIAAHAADVGLPGRRRRAAGQRRTGSTIRRRSPRRSGSAIRRRGIWPSPRGTSPAAGSARSPTRRSWRRIATWLARRGSSASRHRRRAWPVSGAPRPRASSIRTRTVVCVLTGHGLKDPTTAEAPGGGVHRIGTDGRRGRRRTGVVGRLDGRALAG